MPHTHLISSETCTTAEYLWSCLNGQLISITPKKAPSMSHGSGMRSEPLLECLMLCLVANQRSSSWL